MEEEKSKESHEVVEDARENRTLNPSFAGALFMGDLRAEMLFPFPTTSLDSQTEVDEFTRSIVTLLKEKLDPEAVDETGEIPAQVIEGLGSIGAFAIKIPKEYGGLGFSQTAYNRVMMAVASHCASTAVLLSAHQSIGVPQPLKMFGSEAQKKKYFPRFRKGAISAFALTEIDVGSDPARMQAEAKYSPDENCYILNGNKLWCTNGPIAEIIIVIAKTAPKIVKGKEKAQFSAFILEMNTPGIKVMQRCKFMGLSGIHNGFLSFKDVKIPKENLLGEEGRGFAMALSTLNVGRLTLPAACLGIAKSALSIARSWGKERVQWGAPIGEHEAGSEKLAYIAASTFAMESMTWLTSGWLDQATTDIRIEAAMTKLFCSEALWNIVDLTLQLRGGRGYEKASSLKARGEKSYPVERLFRDCRINTIIEGSSEIMKLFLAREALDGHLQKLSFLLGKEKNGMSIKNIFGMLKFYSVWYPKKVVKSWQQSSFEHLGSFGPHFSFIEKCSNLLAKEIFHAMMRHGKGLEKKQLLLGRLMDVGVELFAMSATCSYAKHMQTINPSDTSYAELANFFCAQSKTRIASHFHSLKSNNDYKSDQVAKHLLDGKFLWLEDGIIESNI